MTVVTVFKMGDGNLVRFWKDKWMENEQLRYVSPKSFEISNCKKVFVSAIYRRGVNRVGPSNIRDYRVQEQKED